MKAMLQNEEDLSKPPRIKVSTIHGAKGGEATNVVLFLNQTANTIKGSQEISSKRRRRIQSLVCRSDPNYRKFIFNKM